MKENWTFQDKKVLKKTGIMAILLLVLIVLVSVPAVAWFSQGSNIAPYAPISNPESMYIGAGHIKFAEDASDTDEFEDIRYLYLSGIDVNDNVDHYDYVFCIYGKSVSGFKIQLAYTTNNQFTYELYHAVESEVSGSIEYTTHGETPQTYYYSIDQTKNGGNPISVTYLNKQVVGTETLADSTFHTDTYGSYSSSYVNKYAEPIYLQTTSVIRGSNRAEFDGTTNFVRYFILRVNLNGKEINDRETDVICIAAKTFTYSD